jgi:sterol-4alpha-carboxylate 3-dehydrogenase (decarboxylating)
MAPERIFVTGGTGFVGIATLKALHEQHPEYELWSFDIKPPAVALPYVTYITGDNTSADDTDAAIKKVQPTCVVATAGVVPPLADRYSRRLQEHVYGINIDGTRHSLESARAHGARAFVYTSSCCAVVDDMRYSYPNVNETWNTSPTQSTIYGESKARAEALVLAANDPDGTVPSSEVLGTETRAAKAIRLKSKPFLTCALRPSVVFGEDDYQLVPSIHHCIAKYETPFVVGSGLNLWDVTHVDNIADSHVLAVANLLSDKPTAAGESFFIGNDAPIPFRDFCRQIWKNFGHYPPFEIHIPHELARAVAGISDFLGGWLGLPVTLSGGSIGDALAMRYAAPDKARRILGYEPRLSLEEGLRRSCQVRRTLRR